MFVGLKKRTATHKRNYKMNTTFNGTPQEHLWPKFWFDLNVFNLKKGQQNLSRLKCIERALIYEISTINLRPGFYNISPDLIKLIIKKCGILKESTNDEVKQLK